MEEAFTSIAEHIVFGRPRPARRALLAVRQRLLWAGLASGRLRPSLPRLPPAVVQSVAMRLATKVGGPGRVGLLDNVLRRHDQAKGSRALDSQWSEPVSRLNGMAGAGRVGGSPRAGSGGAGSNGRSRVDVAAQDVQPEEEGCC